MATKRTKDLTLADRLSRLTYQEACRLLGERGEALLQRGGAWDIDLDDCVTLTEARFELELPGAVVALCLRDDRRRGLAWSCSACQVACEHAGAALSLVLEEKMALGLAAAPAPAAPVESLGEEELVAQALAERAARARDESMRLRSADAGRPWADYTVTSAESGKSYRVALRGEERGASYCSCPDFRKNTLGTCKHILRALDKVRRKFPPAVRRRPYRRTGISLHLSYGRAVELRLRLPERLPDGALPVVRPIADRAIGDVRDLVRRLEKLERMGLSVTVYPDAEEYIEAALHGARIDDLVRGIRADPARHPLRSGLLRAELLPYQLDGIAFAAGAGRAILADDMGLGKTIQAIGLAELLAREAGIRRVLVVCPASVKAQWRGEIARFSERSCQLVTGPAPSRAAQYGGDAFFTVCNYEQVLRDLLPIERVAWDLIVLDEGQRIKNWEARTSEVIKGLRSRFALVLSGTPLENRLDDLYSVVEFIDDRRLGPAFRFFNRHREADERGKVLGYKNLAELRRRLEPILLRRTRASVARELPPRTTEIVRIAPTDEQAGLHAEYLKIVAQIVRKRYLTEMDLLRLRKALLMCRMVADGTYLVTRKEPAYSSKLVELEGLLERLCGEPERKVVLFSEWTTMLDLIEPMLQKRRVGYVRLDGSVPQGRRQGLVHAFQSDPGCRLFLTTNAGSTGLNLQAADTVINVDLPWNPAVLEQRVARAHRMGQKRPVHVFVLVTEGTIEENLLATLSAKHELALAALDSESDVDAVEMTSGMEELRRRLEQLLGARPEAPVDESQRAERAEETDRLAAQRERIAAAGGQLLSAAFALLGELVPTAGDTPEARKAVDLVRAQLAGCVGQDDAGRTQLTVTLPDSSALDALASSLGRLLSHSLPSAPMN